MSLSALQTIAAQLGLASSVEGGVFAVTGPREASVSFLHEAVDGGATYIGATGVFQDLSNQAILTRRFLIS